MIFVNVVKPTHICNLACKYCYNDDVRDPVMSQEVLERMTEQTISYCEEKKGFFSEIHFIWHGGEPMVPGKRFYEKVVATQTKYSKTIPIKNSIQTNGLLLNDEWLDFFVEKKFSISISIDGPKHLNDSLRVTHRGQGSFDRVMKAVKLMKSRGIGFGACFMLSKTTLDHAEEVVDFFAKEKIPFNVIPLTKSGDARKNYEDVGLDDNEYGEAWIRMYDRWLALGDDYIYCQDFALKTRAILYGKGVGCVSMANCSNFNISVDPMGDVYACSTLSGSQHTKYGNLANKSLEELMRSPLCADYQNRAVDPHCQTCKWQHVCHGGCAARSYKFFGDIHRRDYYCPSLYAMYEHIEKRLSERGVAVSGRDPLHLTDGFTKEVYDKYSTPPSMVKPRRYIPIAKQNPA